MPERLQQLFRREVALKSFSERSIENARRARDDLFGVQNSRKALKGMLAGLLDPTIFAKLQSKEAKQRQEMQARAGQDAKFKEALAAYGKIKTAQTAIIKNAPTYDYYEGRGGRPRGFAGTLFDDARTLARNAEERKKPNGERLPPYRESSRESLELRLFSAEPIYDNVEELLLTDSLTDLATRFGADDPLVKKVLAGKSPSERATELVTGTKLKDVAFRKKLYTADSAAIKAAQRSDARSRHVGRSDCARRAQGLR